MRLFLFTVSVAFASLRGTLALGNPGLVTSIPHYGPNITVEHLFYGNGPVGITVSRTGRKFVTYTRPSNYTIAELVSDTTDVPWPSLAIHTPPSLVNASDPTYGTNYKDYLLNVQSVVVDAKERLWALDTGRPTVNGYRLYNSGGAKIVAFDLNTNSSTPLISISFPLDVVYPESFINDIRFDLRPEITKAGKGIAYITDTSEEGRNGLVIVDLGTGRSWRHLELHPSTQFEEGIVTSYNNYTFVPVFPSMGYYSQLTTGANGIALSHDGNWLYYSALASRTWSRIPTALLRVPQSGADSTPTAGLEARRAVEYLGRLSSHLAGFEADQSGTIYMGAPEVNAVYSWNPEKAVLETYVQDGLIQWPDTFSAGANKRLYFTVNQLWFSAGFQNGTEKRFKPYGLLSVPIPANRVELV